MPDDRLERTRKAYDTPEHWNTIEPDEPDTPPEPTPEPEPVRGDDHGIASCF